MAEQFLLTQMLLLGLATVVLTVHLLREQPILAPILLFGALGILIVGVTVSVVGSLTVAVPWFAPMGVLLVSYLIYRLYEGWGI